MAMKQSVMESVFNFGLWRSLVLVKLYAFTKTGSEGAYGKGLAQSFFSFQAVMESVFSKTIGFIINGSEANSDRASDFRF